MKKYLLLLASAALLLVGCAKEKLSIESGADEMVTATFTAQMQSAPQTKAVTDGGGTKANRCVMEIYYGGELYFRDVQSVSGMKATFTPTLVSNRTYDVLFWADCGEGLADKYYKTDAENLGLQAVEMMATNYAANDDYRDAFFVKERVEVLQQVSTKEFELTRPFSQVNIITTDAAIIKNANLYPDGVKMVYTAPTKFNLLSGELSEAKVLTVTGAPYETFNASSAALTLEMDYLFAGMEKSALDIDFEASKTGETNVTSHSFTNIPVQRNYRTNIKGALLTTTGNWVAEIVPGWNEPAEEVKFVEAGSVAAANEAFANGATSVKITSVGEETTLYLPVLTDEVTIDFANPDKGVTVQYGPAPTKAAGDKPAAVNIATNDVTKFTVTGISNIVWLAGNQAALANALTNATNKQVVALANDITMSGEWVPVTSAKNGEGHYYGTFDGRNHTISNLKVTDYTGTYVGFFSHVSGATIKNVTFKNATLTNAESLGGNARGAVIAGWSYACNIDNCHVINSSVTGCQKVGGILGSMSVEGAAGLNSVTNCSVDGLTISCNIEKDLFQSGALIGYIQFINANPDGILIENNSVKDITFNDDSSDYGNVGYYNGTFIGTISRKQQVDGQKIVLNNNTISGTNTELFKTIYSSPYFGWATNAENYTGAIAPILIDGEEWTPNYPFKNVTTGKGYATLDAALTALKASETLEIWQAGEYTVETLKSPANSTIDAKVEGVVFNHTAAASSWIASDAISGRTVKNITWNIGNANYQALHVANLVGCTINGRFYPHGGPATFTDCVFNAPGYDYCLWTWNNDATFKSCTFNTQGKAVNVYGSSTNIYNFEDCIFNATNIPEGKGKAAIFVKDGVDTDNDNAKVNVYIKNCTANYERPYNQLDNDPQLSESVLWNVEIGSLANTNEIAITVDDEKVYPFTKFKVNDVAGLQRAVEMFNNSKQKVEHTIIVNDGTYEVSDLLIRKNLTGKSLVMKAANPKGATLKVKAGGENPYIFIFDGCSSYDETRTTSFEGINFDLSAISSTTAVAQSMSGNENRYGAGIIFDGCDLTGGNSMNKNAMYFSSPNHSSPNVVIKNCSIANVGYLASCYAGEFVAENVTTTTNVKHFINNQTSGITTVKDCVVNCNTDYAIRSNGGFISITGSTFNMTYDGSDCGGIFVNRRPNAQLTMTGNTYPASYVGVNMHDIYNDPDGGYGGNLILNDGSGTAKTITTDNENNYYDFPRQ